MLHYSNDGVNFKTIRGIFLNNGSYKDLDMGMFARSKYRQFVFPFAGMVDSSSRIDMLETMIGKEYGNSKMR